MKIFPGKLLAGLLLIAASAISLSAQVSRLAQYNVVWDSQSKNSGESMPCGGGDIGLNVWVENGDLMFYLSRSGAFDENNLFPKFGRIRVRLTPNPFAGGEFRQELKLKEGYVEIFGKNNFLSCFIWKKAAGSQNDANYVAISHEYIIGYAKNLNYCELNPLPLSDDTIKAYKLVDEHVKTRGKFQLRNLYLESFDKV